VCLRLDETAHDAERPEQRAVAQEQPGNDRVVRALPGLDSTVTEKQLPRFWSRIPVPGATMPEPKLAYRLWMNETAIRSASTAQR